MEKLFNMKLGGMAAALKEQNDSTSMGNLTFEERVAMMVDREWTYRENRRLAIRLKLQLQWRTSIIGIRGALTNPSS